MRISRLFKQAVVTHHQLLNVKYANRLIILATCLLCLNGCHTTHNSAAMPSPPAIKGGNIYSLGHNPSGYNRSSYVNSRQRVAELEKRGELQLIDEGQRITLILPTDKYFVFNTAELDFRKSATLSDIATLIACFPTSDIFVAGFTDDIGSVPHQKRLSQQRAQTIAAYLWSNGISQHQLHTGGYGEKFPPSDNRLIHSSSQNRRVEIQWTTC